MPRYFLHVRHGSSVMEDTDGEEFASLDAARSDALWAAREIMQDLVAQGRRPDDGAVVIADDAGTALATVGFMDALGPG